MRMIAVGLGLHPLQPAAAAGDDGIPPAAALDGVLPFRPVRQAGSNRKVFAHWVAFPLSIDNKPAADDYYTRVWLNPKNPDGPYGAYGAFIGERPLPRAPRPGADWPVEDMAQDIRWADAIGIDAFLFNVISVDQGSMYWRMLRDALAGARRVGGTFRIAPNLDAYILKDQAVPPVAAALKTIAHDPGLYRLPAGELLIGAFMAEAWPAEKWRELFNMLETDGIRASFLPSFLNIRNATPEHIQMAAVISEFSGNYPEAIPLVVADTASRVRANAKPWCAPVWSQDSRPKNGVYGEAANSRLFRDGWTSAIRSQADHVQFITWNDYSESTELRPSTGIQYSFYDLAAYYIAWFKSGQPPEIVRDVLYYFHRVQTVNASTVLTVQKKPMVLQWGRAPVNEIELVGFLTAPGQLEIEISGRTQSQRAPAGLTSMRVPLAPGRPSFRLKRGDKTIIDFASAFTISEVAEYQDLLYRGGSSTRQSVATDSRAN
jgi:hypothetical protein